MSAATGPAEGTAPKSGGLARLGLVAGPFLTMLDASIVNVALPDMARQLDSPLSTVQWAASGYLLALAMVLGVSAYLAKRFGTWRAYLASLLGFTVASGLCALAPTVELLIAARALQGASGAPLVPLAIGVLLADRNDEERRGVSPLAGMLFFLAPALGPTVGGILVETAGWPSIFLINVPLGLLGFFAVLRGGADVFGAGGAVGGDRGVRPDALGLLLLAGGLALVTYGTAEGQLRGLLSPGVWPLWAGGSSLMASYVLWALRREHPAVDLKLLRHPQGALSAGLCALVAVVLFAVSFLLPAFLQGVRGLSAFEAGLMLLPQGLVMGLGTAFGDRFARRYGVRAVVLVGVAVLAAATAMLLLVGLDTPAWIIAAILSGRGLALGLTIQPLLGAMIGSLKPEEVPDGSTLFNVAQRLGGSVGIALLFSFFEARERVHVNEALRSMGAGAAGLSTGHSHNTMNLAALPEGVRNKLAEAATAGFHDTVWVLVVVCLAGLMAATLLRRRPPAPFVEGSEPKEAP